MRSLRAAATRPIWVPRCSLTRWWCARIGVALRWRKTASTAAHRTSREPCLVMCPRRSFSSDAWCGGGEPGPSAQVPSGGEPRDVADLGHEDCGQHRADPGDGLDDVVAEAAGEVRCGLLLQHDDLPVAATSSTACTSSACRQPRAEWPSDQPPPLVRPKSSGPSTSPSPAASSTSSFQRRSIAVGTALDRKSPALGGPPHRSQRALLAHWAPALGANAKAHDRERVHGAGRRQPIRRVAVHLRPVEPGPLAAAPERLEPVPGHLITKCCHCIGVAGHGVVGEMSSHHAAEPLPLLGDGEMPAPLEFIFDLMQLGPHPLRDGLALEPETPALVLPADVREAQEVERLGLPVAPGRTIPGGIAPELDEPGLVGMQLQAELRETLTKVGEELLRIGLMLESGHEVIGLCRVPD